MLTTNQLMSKYPGVRVESFEIRPDAGEINNALITVKRRAQPLSSIIRLMCRMVLRKMVVYR